MITWVQTLIYGIIQGITEWLPISSTGHLLLADELMKMQVFDNPVLNEEFLNMFFVVIQFGSILAVCLLYFHKAPALHQGVCGKRGIFHSQLFRRGI